MKLLNKMLRVFSKVLLFVFLGLLIILISASTLRGVKGNPKPNEIRHELQKEGGPFELSPERSRYAIVQSLVENKSFSFSKEIAEYTEPDLGYKDGKFVSLIAPGVSLLVYPLYVLGKSFDLAQVATFSLSAIVGILNLLLISLIVKRLTGNWAAGMVAGLVFLFGTIAWVYSSTLYHHHFTTFFLLVSVWVLLKEVKFYTAFLVALCAGLSFFIEYPNVAFFIPIIIYTIAKHIKLEKITDKYVVKFKLAIFGGILGIALALIPTYLFNLYSYGNPLQIASTVGSTKGLDINWETGEVKEKEKSSKPKTAINFFKSERLPGGLNVLLMSEDRGLILFNPVVVFGILGISVLYKKNRGITYTILGVILIILLLYGMWGDPWGGWGFGPRYLIPAIGFASIFLGVAINHYGRKILFFITFFPILLYSIIISLAGALTTIRLPPSVEADYADFPRIIFLHAFDLIKINVSGSFVYKTFFENTVTLQNYGIIIFITVSFLILIFYVISIKIAKELPKNV